MSLINCVRAALPQGGALALNTVHQTSTATPVPVRQSPTPRSPTVTSAKTALFTLRRGTPLSHALHHHLRLQKLPQTSSPPPPRHLSQVYTPETGVEGARQVRDLLHISPSKCWKYWSYHHNHNHHLYFCGWTLGSVVKNIDSITNYPLCFFKMCKLFEHILIEFHHTGYTRQS